MDRQTLLEEKRQRLAQLRQRRYDVLGNSVEKLLEKHQDSPSPKPKLVDVAIQVDLIVNEIASSTISPVVKLESQCATFDKAIQAVPVVPEDLRQNHAKDAAAAESKKPQKLHQVRPPPPQDKAEVSYFSKYCDSRPSTAVTGHQLQNSFELAQKLSPIKNRKVNHIQFSQKYPELVLVSFSSAGIPLGGSRFENRRDSPGLAIIYSITASKLVPEFYLCCSSPISCIIFDKLEPHKVIAGLTDGRLCIWNLNDCPEQGLEIFPMLSSPLLSTVLESPFDARQHILPITALFQITTDGNSSILSLSLDGVMNVWSSNLLALPKQDSITLFEPKEEDLTQLQEQLRIKLAIMLDNDKLVGTNKENINHEENYFLNSLVVANEAGVLYKLCNDKNKQFITSVHEPNATDSTLATHGILSFKMLLENYLISSNYDWILRLWDLHSSQPLIEIPTDCLIFLIAVRPKAQLQFVTVGVDNSKDYPVVQFWDLGKRLLAPILDIPLIKEDILATSIDFDGEGDQLVIGFDDGSIAVIEIDNSLLNQYVATQTYQPEDGIVGYLSNSY